jgi:hypothetical protein
MSQEKNGLLISVLKKAVGIPTGNSACCGPAPAPAPKDSLEHKTDHTGSCCGAR